MEGPMEGAYGKKFKEEARRYYGSLVHLAGRGEMIPNDDSMCEIDPNVKDEYGIPVLRFRFKWTDHEKRQAAHMHATFKTLIESMGGQVLGSVEADGAKAIYPGGAIIHEVGTTCMITSEEWLEHPGSVGRALPPFEALILDDDGQPVPARQEGRLYFRDTTGRGVIYHNDPEKSAAAHIAPGVFTLGEIAYMDDDGHGFITDRFSDMVVSGGVNLYPAEAEQVLIDHPDIADVACIGIPHPEMGEELRALAAGHVTRTSYSPASTLSNRHSARDDVSSIVQYAARPASLPETGAA